MSDGEIIKSDIPESHDGDETIVLSEREQAVLEAVTGGNWKKYGRVAMAALGGIPWVGSLLGAAAALSGENEQGHTNELLFLWVQNHEQQLKELITTLWHVFKRFESFGDQIQTRIESQEYLTLVRKTFQQWDQAETGEKKDMLRKLITNAGGISLAEDDLIRLFLDWIEKYHEFHFAVIREVYKNPRATRGGIWAQIRGEIPREDSYEADLFKLLIRDLSTGGVIRQARETDYAGNFIRQARQSGSRRQASDTMESAFEDSKQYVLTELGSRFVHYVMDDLAPQIEDSATLPPV